MPARTGFGNARAVQRSYRPPERGKALGNPRRKVGLAQAMQANRGNPGIGGNQAVPQGGGLDQSFQAGLGQQEVDRRRPPHRPGLDQSFQAGLGQQLSSRVSSGAIDQAQAQRTASERALLEQEYGPEWRATVYGDRGYVKRTRKALKNNPDSKRAKALYGNLMKLRAKALAKAGG